MRDSAASVSRRDAWARRLPLLPAFIYVFLLTQIPFVLTIYYSFFSWNLLKEGSFKFAGLDNYTRLITNESIRTAILNTVVLTLAVIAISVVLGMAVAMLLNSEVWGKGFMRTLMIAPFLIMPTAGALIWKDTLLNPLFGLLPYLLTPLGLSRVDWVNRFPMATVVAVEVWRWTPFMMLIILAGLQSQNPEVLEASRVDGANAFQAFRRITLPLVRPALIVAILFRVLDVLRIYDLPAILTGGGGGTGHATTTLSILVVDQIRQGFNSAAALSTITFLFIFLVAFVFVRFLGANVVQTQQRQQKGAL